MSSKKKKKVSHKRAIKDEMKDKIREEHKNDETKKTYNVGVNSFVEYCHKHHGCKYSFECVDHIQEYIDHLAKEGYSPYTIHTYLAAVCNFYNIPMCNFKKPIRYAADCTKGRKGNNRIERPDNNPDNPKFAKSVEFQKRVGIRRAEMTRLTGADFCKDEDGYPCVVVRRGKGGKFTMQRILPEDVEFIESYFKDKKSDEKIFKEKEISSHMSYHSFRHENAMRTYNYYLERIENEEGYAEQLEEEIRRRWNKYNIDADTNMPKEFKEELIKDDDYEIKGKNIALAKKKGLPLAYNRLALLACSVFHLSHWRLGVTVKNYILAVDNTD
ncbi:MAG: hypothetical protein E7555_03195 [Ruminococcaceae bacterium]|nr:hypothetical protein [Oscillospiraceae bacterium]